MEFPSNRPVLMVNFSETQSSRIHLTLVVVMKVLMANSSLISGTGISIVTAEVSLVMVMV